MYTKEQFYQDVLTEATALRDLSTPEEKEKLDYIRLLPSNREKCIYGLMTGSCNSPRAIELMQKCCPQYFHNETNLDTIDLVLAHVDGKDSEEVSHRSGSTVIYRFSSIEAYILIDDTNRSGLIDYIKGETSAVNLKIK